MSGQRDKIKTISVLGPTASGKTALAVELAKLVGGEIISCDSMQLYRGMDIGTATPSLDERGGIAHHLFDVVSPYEEFSAADYADLAKAAVQETVSRGNIPIFCGGTGMYHDAVTRINEFGENKKDERLRGELYDYAERNGNAALHAMLCEIDPESAAAIHENNVKRVVRAIEIYRLTGKTKSETDREQTAGESAYDDTVFVIDFADRALLYDRINRRVDIMMESGLEDEARRLLLSGKPLGKTAMQAIGYKEFLPYFRGECSLADVAEEIKLASRHYAKRQMIWFRRDKTAHRLVPDEKYEETGRLKIAEELAAEAADVFRHAE